LQSKEGLKDEGLKSEIAKQRRELGLREITDWSED